MDAQCALFNLRQSLEALGYTDPLPCTAAPLVEAILRDYLKTAEDLREAQKQINCLIEEKRCRNFGMDPCRCENTRLLVECNKLREDLIKQQVECECMSKELHKRIMDLETEKCNLNEQYQHLLKRAKTCISNDIGLKCTKNKKVGTNPAPCKKPFISTIRPGEYLPGPYDPTAKCNKCMLGCTKPSESKSPSAEKPTEIQILKCTIRNLVDQVGLYKKKVQDHDREIERLNRLATVNNWQYDQCPENNCSPFA